MQSMALDSFQLLARQSEATEGELQVKILQTLFDLIILHGINFGEERGFGVSRFPPMYSDPALELIFLARIAGRHHPRLLE